MQLFNAAAIVARDGEAGGGEAERPDHRRGEAVLREAGFGVETVPVHGRPWNPAFGMHNAYAGLDPLRAWRVLLTRRDAAVVCAHLESAVIVLLLRRLLRFRPPVVIWEVPWSPGWTYRRIVSRLALPRADCAVVFSSAQIGLLRERYGRDVTAAFVPFCIDTTFFCPGPARGGGAEVAGKPYVFSCGLDEGRDFDTLLLAARETGVPVVIKAGNSSIAAGRAGDNVTVITERLSYAALRELYRGAAAVVVTTRQTTNASGVTSLMEAMATGRPVIVSDNGALRDYLPPPRAGIVIPVGDAAALRAAIGRVLDDPERAATMGREARRHAEACFAPRRHFAAMAALLTDVIERNEAGPKERLSMLHTIARAVPLAAYQPFRRGSVRFRRGSLPRKLCIAVVKVAARAYRGRLAGRLAQIRPLDAPHLSFLATDSMVMDAVYWTGVQGYEGRVVEVWAALCERARAVLEVGGNVGLFTVIGGRGAAAYTVIEPVPGNAAVLRQNLARNGLSRVELREAAAIPAAAASAVTLNVPDEGRAAPVGSHLTEGVEIDARSSAGCIRVEGLPFRDLVAGRDLVKIDAEGIEAELLDSARDIILAERPTMMIEVLPEATRLAALIAELARTGGYAIHIVPEWGSQEIVTVAAEAFTAALPGRFNSKDIVMSTAALPI